MKLETKLVHISTPDVLTGAISTPIYQTSSYVQEEPDVNKGFAYTRTANPTRKVVEQAIAELEGGISGFAFSSGLAATDCVLKLLKQGDEIIAVNDVYGGTYRIVTTVYNKFGVTSKFIDTTDIQNVLQAVSNKTRFIWLETPTNPTLKISDIEEIAKISKQVGALLIVDNTFLSPALQQPIRLGADIVVHSGTKYLSGHGDVLSGFIVVKDPKIAEELKYLQNTSGGVLSPFDSWLTLRGIQTLSLRMEKHSQNAQKIAEFLTTHPKVDKVYYPGLKNHPNHHIATKQQKGFGGMVSFSLKDDTLEAAKDFLTRTKIFLLAENLGDVRSLGSHPATMTHKSTPLEVRKETGIQDSLIRLSVGIENVDDLINDIKQALD
ncbi:MULTISPECIES: PLP-dependent aspartate aminotransferase family protein [unclassified Apibacter]|uniref:trans-sulfuration enzyme family protein n=1 Tax=unclassified Apibacter TaxID=2630820 RepID=UPI00135DF1D1|nr:MULTISPECIES: PLP-dependent aspartate aminotransferase family protein [unclassified Apibacter]MXP05833.1 aminotransferase class V-fold PLP-dependent enzyme [Apibacter sp. B3546]MXP12544.1 aminotransferase class V-fold PLP-dependent enzyme [Apibacter sp. B3239]